MTKCIVILTVIKNDSSPTTKTLIYENTFTLDQNTMSQFEAIFKQLFISKCELVCLNTELTR